MCVFLSQLVATILNGGDSEGFMKICPVSFKYRAQLVSEGKYPERGEI